MMDLIAVGVLAILGNLAVVGVQSRTTSGKVHRFLEIIGLAQLSIQTQALILGATALSLLLLKSLLSIILIKKSLHGISTASGHISSELIEKVFSLNRIQTLGLAPQEVLYSVTQGITLVTIGIVGTFVTIIGDVGLIALMFTGILILNPLIALLSFAIFGFTSIVLSKHLHARAVDLGSQTANLNIESNRLILESVMLHSDLLIRNRVNLFTDKISLTRTKLMDTNRQQIFLPNISKYVFETTILIGAFFLASVEFILFDAPTAVASLTLFMASGSRVIPALLRSQQGIMAIRTNLSASDVTLSLVEKLKESQYISETRTAADFKHKNFIPEVRIEDLDFKFGEGDGFALKKINLELKSGEFVAIVGKSGSGKSTLLNLIIGLENPSHGRINISGVSPRTATSQWTGALAYVPQDIKIIDNSIRENILLGFTTDEVSDQEIFGILQLLGLSELVSRPDGLDTRISQFYGGLSGGQIQRIGIARALITKPKLIILDEATSSLDAETESTVNSLFQSLHGKVTVIVVAHRLSTVQNADRLYWMEQGRIINSGTFQELRNSNKNFENNVLLLGL
jgi:ATP-binding cassette subfamily C protein